MLLLLRLLLLLLLILLLLSRHLRHLLPLQPRLRFLLPPPPHPPPHLLPCLSLDASPCMRARLGRPPPRLAQKGRRAAGRRLVRARAPVEVGSTLTSRIRWCGDSNVQHDLERNVEGIPHHSLHRGAGERQSAIQYGCKHE
ncbi:unnamed protein product [Closterium sp. NIES-53]